MKIQQYKLERVVTEERDWELPTEPKYFFQTGIRRSIAIVPEWTTWNKEQYQKDEEIWQLKIVCVYQSFEAKIESYTIMVSAINDAYVSKTDNVIKFLIDYSHNGYDRTKEQFQADFDACLKSITEHLV